MPPFQYKPRDPAAWDKRASGSLFEGFVKDEFPLYQMKKENWIRILPPTWNDAKHYGLDIFVHYGVGPNNATVLCLYKMRNQRCPLCEAYAKAEAAGRDDKAAKDLKPTRRILIWLLDRKEEKRPLLCALPWTVDRDISQICRDRMTGELYYIDNPDSGYDVYFNREQKGQSTQNVEYSGFQLSRQPSPVKDEYLTYICDHPVDTTLQWRTYEEVLSLFEGAPPDDKPNQQAVPAQFSTPLHSVPTPEPAPVAAPMAPPQFVPEWTGTHCSICQQGQFTTPTGVVCVAGHANAESIEEIQLRQAPPPPVPPPPSLPPTPPPVAAAPPAPPAPIQPRPQTVVPPAAPAPTANPPAQSKAAAMRARFVTPGAGK